MGGIVVVAEDDGDGDGGAEPPQPTSPIQLHPTRVSPTATERPERIHGFM
jgi:hypothetical protein